MTNRSSKQGVQKNRLRFRHLGAVLTFTVGGVIIAGAVAVPTAAHAQIPFSVISPENGAAVRETVHIQMSRKALDDLGVKYLSISIDGKFKAAVTVLKLPAVETSMTSGTVAISPQMVTLLWDTKLPPSGSNGSVNPLGVEDGPHTFEIVAETADGRRIGAQTLSINVLNRGGLQIPADGLDMSYKFQVGDTSKYRETTVVEYEGEHVNPATPADDFGGGGRRAVSPGFNPNGRANFGGSNAFGGGFGSGGGQSRSFSPASPSVAGAGTGPFTVLVQNVRAMFERTTEDELGGDLFFLRDKVTDGTFISGNGAAGRLQDIYSLKSRYRSVFASGRVSDSGLANAEHPGAYIAMPIPNLGGGRRRIGQTWNTLTPIKLEWATLDKPPVVSATNTLEGLEWQDGYQTARILQTFDGKADIPIFGGAGTIKGADIHMSQTIWFAYRAGKIIRMETDMTVSGATPAALLATLVPGAGAPGEGQPDFGGAGLNGISQDKGGSFGQLVATQPREEARVPAKFHGTSTIQLILPGTP